MPIISALFLAFLELSDTKVSSHATMAGTWAGGHHITKAPAASLRQICILSLHIVPIRFYISHCLGELDTAHFSAHKALGGYAWGQREKKTTAQVD
jgi:hypothetical protein